MQLAVLCTAAGDHGSTFAGNPLVCATACSVFDTISAASFLDSVVAKGERLRAGLRAATAGNSHVKEVRREEENADMCWSWDSTSSAWLSAYWAFAASKRVDHHIVH